MRHRFVDDQLIDALALPGTDAVGEEVWWDYDAGYLTDELILACATGPDQDVHVLVQRQPLRLLGNIAYPGGDPPGWLRCFPGRGLADGRLRADTTLAAARPASVRRPVRTELSGEPEPARQHLAEPGLDDVGGFEFELDLILDGLQRLRDST